MPPYSSVYFVICFNLSSKSLPYSDMRYPKYLKSVTCSIMLSFITIFTLCMWFPHIAMDFVILYFLAIRTPVTHCIKFVSGKLRPCCWECSVVYWKVMDSVQYAHLSIQSYGLSCRVFFVTPCSLVGWRRCFGRTSCPHLQGWSFFFLPGLQDF